MNAIVDHKSFARSSNADTAVSLFDFKGHQIRVVMVDGEPWFVAGDVCDALGLKPDATNRSYQNHYRRLDTTEQTLSVVPSGLSTRRMKAVSESGLYKLVMRSDKPEAKPFQDWVTREVLPSIRKHGGYILGQEEGCATFCPFGPTSWTIRLPHPPQSPPAESTAASPIVPPLGPSLRHLHQSNILV